MAAMQADYGERTPMDFDRFGVRHHVRVTTAHRIREYMDCDPYAIVRRLGLTLRGWAKRWPGMEVFHLDVRGRSLEIRSYSDGRIKIWLDDAPVYTENIKIVTRHGVRHREVEQWFDPAVAEEETKAAQAARHRSTYEGLKAKLRNPANTPDDAVDITDSVPQYDPS